MARAIEAINIRAPGIFGLSTHQATSSTDPRYALEFQNFVFDDANRPAARKGWSFLTSSPHSANITALHEYIESATTSRIISASGGDLWEGTTTLTNRKGSLSHTADNWQFLNFNGKVVGVQQGHNPIVKTGAGNFSNITAASGSVPTGNCGLSAWGRLFITDADQKTIKWCGLLAETNWGGAADAGSLDTAEVWPDGLDRIVALGVWANFLVIFGTRSVLLYENGHQPAHATAGLSLKDVLPRAGAVGRDSIQSIGTDLLFLSQDGLRSLERNIAFSTVPLTEVTTNVKDDLISDIASATNATIQSTYNATEGLYILRLGANYWAFDTKHKLEDGSLRASKWSGINFKSITTASDDVTYLGQTGGVATYGTYKDNTSSYSLQYRSTWLDFDSNFLKFLRRAHLTTVSEANYSVVFKTSFDFDDSVFNSSEANLPTNVRKVAEYDGVSDATTADSFHEWGTAEYSGATNLVNKLAFDLGGAGHKIQVGYSVTINGHNFATQELKLLAKAGRISHE